MVAIDPMASMTMEVTLDGLVEDLVRMKAFHRDAHPAATLVMAETYVKIIDQVFAKHHDTNRYINGYITALHDIGLDSVPLKPYKKSSRHDDYIEKLKEQYEGLVEKGKRMKGFLDLARNQDAMDPPRKDGKPRKKRTEQRWYRKLERLYQKNIKRQTDAFVSYFEATSTESILFIHGRKGRLLKNGLVGVSRLDSVRSRIYGGNGRMTLLGQQVIIELHNLEPHSWIIETRPGYGFPHKTAMIRLSVLGAKNVSRRYIERQAHLMNRRLVSAGEIRAHNAQRHTILFTNDAA